MAVGSAIYGDPAAGAAGGPGGFNPEDMAGGPDMGADDVVDADFEEVGGDDAAAGDGSGEDDNDK